MIRQAQERGIVIDWTTLYDEFLSKAEKVNLRSLPYMEGDYWTDTVEDILKVRVTGGLGLCSAQTNFNKSSV